MFISKKKKIEIAKKLAAISYIATYNCENADCSEKIIEHTADIAYDIGGEFLLELTKLYFDEIWLREN